MTDEQRIEEAALELSTYRPDQAHEGLNVPASDQYAGFKAGVAWRDANPKPVAESDEKLRDDLFSKFYDSIDFSITADFSKDMKTAWDECWNAARTNPDPRVMGLVDRLKATNLALEECGDFEVTRHLNEKIIRKFERGGT